MVIVIASAEDLDSVRQRCLSSDSSLTGLRFVHCVQKRTAKIFFSFLQESHTHTRIAINPYAVNLELQIVLMKDSTAWGQRPLLAWCQPWQDLQSCVTFGIVGDSV